MPAWFVSKRHIDIIVTAAQKECLEYRHGDERDDPLTVGGANRLGKALWEENARSLDARYGERPDAAGIDEYVFEKVVVDNGQVAKALNSYDYQTCEHPDWAPGNPVFDFTRELAFALLDSIQGYKEGDWAP